MKKVFGLTKLRSMTIQKMNYILKDIMIVEKVQEREFNLV